MNLFHDYTFTWWEAGLFKVCLISLGILLGTYFESYLMSYVYVWWALFLSITTYFIAKVMRGWSTHPPSV